MFVQGRLTKSDTRISPSGNDNHATFRIVLITFLLHSDSQFENRQVDLTFSPYLNAGIVGLLIEMSGSKDKAMQ